MRYPRHLLAVELVDQATVEPGTPALVGTVVDACASAVDVSELTLCALAVLILKVRKNRRTLPGRAAGELRAEPARSRTTLLGRDDDDAVGRARAVKRRRVGALEDAERLDVVRIEIVDRAAEIVSADDSAATARVGHRDTIDNEERLVAACEGVLTTDDDVGRSALRAGAGDLNACDLALNLLHDVLGAGLVQLFIRELLLGCAELALFLDDSKSRDHDALELGRSADDGEVLRNVVAREPDLRR